MKTETTNARPTHRIFAVTKRGVFSFGDDPSREELPTACGWLSISLTT
jgi:hypothetical protein